MIGALGGGAWATGWVILVNAVSYGAVIWQLRAMDATLLHPSKPAPRGPGMLRDGVRYVAGQPKMVMILILVFFAGPFGMNFQITSEIGRASCRERVCQYVSISVVAVSFK